MKKWCQFAAKVNNESRIRRSARNWQCYSHWGDCTVILQLIKEFFAYKFMQKLLYFTAPYGSKSITYGNPARRRETLKKEWEVYGGTVNSFMYGVILSGLLSMPTNTQAGQHCSQNWWIFLCLSSHSFLWHSGHSLSLLWRCWWNAVWLGFSPIPSFLSFSALKVNQLDISQVFIAQSLFQ